MIVLVFVAFILILLLSFARAFAPSGNPRRRRVVRRGRAGLVQDTYTDTAPHLFNQPQPNIAPPLFDNSTSTTPPPPDYSFGGGPDPGMASDYGSAADFGSSTDYSGGASGGGDSSNFGGGGDFSGGGAGGSW